MIVAISLASIDLFREVERNKEIKYSREIEINALVQMQDSHR